LNNISLTVQHSASSDNMTVVADRRTIYS